MCGSLHFPCIICIQSVSEEENASIFWSRKAKKKEEEKIDGAFVEGICFLFEK